MRESTSWSASTSTLPPVVVDRVVVVVVFPLTVVVVVDRVVDDDVDCAEAVAATPIATAQAAVATRTLNMEVPLLNCVHLSVRYGSAQRVATRPRRAHVGGMSNAPSPADIVGFWTDAGPTKWFAKDDAFDALFRERFETAHFMAARRELDPWAASPEGSLALLILLDQFPRNVFRGTGHAFATDPLARHFAIQALDAGQDQLVENDLRRFFYLPLQHAEDLALQERQLGLFQTMERPADDRWAEHHHAVIARFGRFPHRNRALGRETTPEEQLFLDDDGFRG